MRIYRQIYGVHGKPEVISVLPNYPKCYHQICWWESTNSCNGSLSFFGCTLKTSFFLYFSLFHPIRSSEWERDGQNEISSHTFWVGKHTLGANILLGFFFLRKNMVAKHTFAFAHGKDSEHIHVAINDVSNIFARAMWTLDNLNTANFCRCVCEWVSVCVWTFGYLSLVAKCRKHQPNRINVRTEWAFS